MKPCTETLQPHVGQQSTPDHKARPRTVSPLSGPPGEAASLRPANRRGVAFLPMAMLIHGLWSRPVTFKKVLFAVSTASW